ncbi:Glycine cleavage system transcriptional activator [Roseovarius sp. THAF27]|uniref:LysR family transcriptional regulator n=1 Tax=Roseovarius sp. THAF27 TaxID=2587850 RepID=UPI001267E6E0|nr:LysR family transcriptional regulator [Roseovarius sp. THAF27]QFT80230.1 Glycine cleavage system transcriptional activator [Roseovarius sp. THAF27]
MNQDRRDLPPLETLIFFTTVMKRGGFSAAAPELMVSQAAVSKRIRQLEDWLGTPLFDRGARHAVPTDTARRLEEPVRLALDYLTASLDTARVTDTRTLQIAANGAVSMFWLYPRLQAFATSPDACNVSVLTADDPSALTADTLDLAIHYGDAPPPGWTGTPLFNETITPAATPAIAATFSDRPDLPLLDYPRLAPDWINWRIWHDRKPGSPLSARPVETCRSYGHSIGRALTGDGIALASLPMLDTLVSSGQLVPVGDDTLTTTRRYWLNHRVTAPLSPNALLLHRALAGPDTV